MLLNVAIVTRIINISPKPATGNATETGIPWCGLLEGSDGSTQQRAVSCARSSRPFPHGRTVQNCRHSKYDILCPLRSHGFSGHGVSHVGRSGAASVGGGPERRAPRRIAHGIPRRCPPERIAPDTCPTAARAVGLSGGVPTVGPSATMRTDRSTRCATQAAVTDGSRVWHARRIAMAKNTAIALYVCGECVEALMQAEHAADVAREHMDDDARRATGTASPAGRRRRRGEGRSRDDGPGAPDPRRPSRPISRRGAERRMTRRRPPTTGLRSLLPSAGRCLLMGPPAQHHSNLCAELNKRPTFIRRDHTGSFHEVRNVWWSPGASHCQPHGHTHGHS